MRYDWLLEPISGDAPCGPDLDEVGDEKYLNYVLPVASRIPARFYKADTDEPVDRSVIKLKEELPVIADLLRQSRDIRLLCIEARLQSFAGDLSGFSDCIVAIAALVERFWEDVHPKAFEGDFTLRQNVLERARRLVADYPAAAASAAGSRQARRYHHLSPRSGRDGERAKAGQ